jgi:hypothetical protein
MSEVEVLSREGSVLVPASLGIYFAQLRKGSKDAKSDDEFKVAREEGDIILSNFLDSGAR